MLEVFHVTFPWQLETEDRSPEASYGQTNHCEAFQRLSSYAMGCNELLWNKITFDYQNSNLRLVCWVFLICFSRCRIIHICRPSFAKYISCVIFLDWLSLKKKKTITEIREKKEEVPGWQIAKNECWYRRIVFIPAYEKYDYKNSRRVMHVL